MTDLKKTASPLIIRDLPGILAVEDATWLHNDERVEKEADVFTEKHFGVSLGDLGFARPDDGTEIDLDELDAERQVHPTRLLLDYMFEETAVPYLLGLGADLRTKHGPPFRSAMALAPVVEAVLRGIAGHLSEPESANVAGFESWIAKEAKSFRRSGPRR
ncbi:hypothetical protein [Bosea lathyri]|uniref:Uncharacterized protein n=1 Tax=Bosea lathyri TaxID=1036778 RepID=A0A1H6BST7_9HYPH|nr:hypothetical protein [Bosea lathyri]SEG63791.1 hypothetical protein SAMN04488115_10833 [Bosea lathyri]